MYHITFILSVHAWRNLMKQKLFFLCLIVAASLFITLPVFANHEWRLRSISCDGNTNTVTIVGEYVGGEDPGLWLFYNVNGSFVNWVEFYNDESPTPALGEYLLTYTNAAFVPGAEVTIDDYPLSTTCTGTTDGPVVVEPVCVNPLPAGSVVHDVPQGAPVFFEPSLDAQANFNLPAGTWYVAEFSGDFAKVWIACAANLVWIPRNAVGGPTPIG
jgi:hypothetical protein